MVFEEDIDKFDDNQIDCLHIPEPGGTNIYFYDRFGYGGYAPMMVYGNRWDIVKSMAVQPRGPMATEGELAAVMNYMGIVRKFCKCNPHRWGNST